MIFLPGFRVWASRHRGHGGHDHPHNDVHHGGGSREIAVQRRVLDANDRLADENRRLFADRNVFVLNVMSSPGSGKTTTLIKTIGQLQALGIQCAVIVGDICTRNDADRLAATGVPAVQINTDLFGGDCHLTAPGIRKALDGLDLSDIDLLIVENVGNLVCPAEFDIGEHARVVVLSVTEGEDKPLKYPLMFRESDVALLNKTDLLPYLDFDSAAAVANIRKVHPDMPVWPVSGKTGDGFAPWIEWIQDRIASK
ncbi:MAG: hydrogenase accessory protein HypB [Deltaproteobacteria bacterium]|nr:MAG: hydrogenase accessory protein HypB [Deltaproteobacteria bacterium]RUA00140.1 MAG: hydrogenase accessory protein HypB [Deltaproteobacteria bacterium]